MPPSLCRFYDGGAIKMYDVFICTRCDKSHVVGEDKTIAYMKIKHAFSKYLKPVTDESKSKIKGIVPDDYIEIKAGAEHYEEKKNV